MLIYTHTRAREHVVTDCGFFSWPWQWFALQRADSHLFVTSNGCITVTDTLGWIAVVFCACDIILLFSVLSRVITDVRKFRSYSYYKRNIWRPVFVTILRREVIEGLSFGGIYTLVLKSLNSLCKSNIFSWGCHIPYKYIHIYTPTVLKLTRSSFSLHTELVGFLGLFKNCYQFIMQN